MRIDALALGILLAVMTAPADAGTRSRSLFEQNLLQWWGQRLAAADLVYSAPEFLDVCEAEAAGRTGSRRPCSAYIAGAFAAKVHFSKNSSDDGFCAPAEAVPGERLRDIFIGYAQRNPDALDVERSDAVSDAFAESFSCS